MKNKKANTLGITIIIGVILIFLIGVGVGIFLLIPQPTQGLIDSTKCILKDEGIVDIEYNCLEGFLCRATPILECSELGDEKIVIGRTDDLDFSDGWIALDNKDTENVDLQEWCDDGSNINPIDLSNPVQLPYGVTGYISFGSYNPCKTSKCLYVKRIGKSGYHEFSRKSCGANLDTTPESDCENQELCIGGAKYQCQENVILIDGETGNQEIVDTLTYSKDNKSPPEDPKKGITYTPSTTTPFLSGDKMRFSKIEFEKWFCPDVLTTCETQTGNELELGEEECVSTILLEKCILGEQGSANIESTTINGTCCLKDNECDDNKENTQDVCVANTCVYNEISGFCYDKEDCTPTHNDWICETNECIYPTTGIYCSPAQQGDTKCENNLLNICRPNDNFEGTFTWQLSQDCSSIGEICVE